MKKKQPPVGVLLYGMFFFLAATHFLLYLIISLSDFEENSVFQSKLFRVLLLGLPGRQNFLKFPSLSFNQCSFLLANFNFDSFCFTFRAFSLFKCVCECEGVCRVMGCSVCHLIDGCITRWTGLLKKVSCGFSCFHVVIFKNNPHPQQFAFYALFFFNINSLGICYTLTHTHTHAHR